MGKWYGSYLEEFGGKDNQPPLAKKHKYYGYVNKGKLMAPKWQELKTGDIIDYPGTEVDKYYVWLDSGDLEYLPKEEYEHRKKTWVLNHTTMEAEPAPEIYDNEIFQLDAINGRVANKLVQRAKKGLETYGKPMTRTDKDLLAWLKEAQEEALDMVVYLERCIFELENNETN